jgi:hypothetical protein
MNRTCYFPACSIMPQPTKANYMNALKSIMFWDLTVYSGRGLPTFRRNILPPSLGSQIKSGKQPARKLETLRSYETSVNVCQTTSHLITEESTFYCRYRENHKSHCTVPYGREWKWMAPLWVAAHGACRSSCSFTALSVWMQNWKECRGKLMVA